MAWLQTLRPIVPFMAIGLLAGLLFGVVTGQLVYFGGMGFAAGTMMGAAWLVRVRRTEQQEEALATLEGPEDAQDVPEDAGPGPGTVSRRK